MGDEETVEEDIEEVEEAEETLPELVTVLDDSTPNALLLCAGLFALGAVYGLPVLVDRLTEPMVERWAEGYHGSATPLGPKPIPVAVPEEVVDEEPQEEPERMEFPQDRRSAFAYSAVMLGTANMGGVIYVPGGCQ